MDPSRVVSGMENARRPTRPGAVGRIGSARQTGSAGIDAPFVRGRFVALPLRFVAGSFGDGIEVCADHRRFTRTQRTFFSLFASDLLALVRLPESVGREERLARWLARMDDRQRQ